MPGYRDVAKLHGGQLQRHALLQRDEEHGAPSQASGCAGAAVELGRPHVNSRRSTAQWCADCTRFTARAVAIDSRAAVEPGLPGFGGAKARECFSNKQV